MKSVPGIKTEDAVVADTPMELSASDGADDDGTWTCSNGHSGNVGNFCPICGEPRPEASSSTVIPWSYSVNFGSDVDDDIDQVNAVLAQVKLSDIDIDDMKAYLVTTTTYKKDSDIIDSISFRGGIRSITLSGEIDESKPSFTYQILSFGYGKDDNMDMDKFMEARNDDLPKESKRIVMWTTFDSGEVFTVLLPLVP